MARQRFATWAELKEGILLPPHADTEAARWDHVKHITLQLDFIEPGDGSPLDRQFTEEAGPDWGGPYWQGTLQARDANHQNLLGPYPEGYPFVTCTCHFGKQTLESALWNAQLVIEMFAAGGARAQVAHYARKGSRILGYRRWWRRHLYLWRCRGWWLRSWLRNLWSDLWDRETEPEGPQEGPGQTTC
jgi:hypothetical protein